MKKNYVQALLKKHPNITSGRKNFRDFERRIKKNLILTSKYFEKLKKTSNK